MFAMPQWQPDLGICPQDTVRVLQTQPSHLSFSNSERQRADFNSIFSLGFIDDPSEQLSPQMSSEMLHARPAAPSAAMNMLPVSQRVPTSTDWETHRTTIIQLYMDEDRTLKDVMHIMRTQHSLNATVKMYKSRLASWDVRKYMTRAERETACRVLKVKQAAGETAGKVIVRGKARNTEVFLRHMRRSRVGVQQRQCPMNGEPPEDIIIDSINTNQPLSQVWLPMYPAGPQRDVEIVCKEMSSLALTTIRTRPDFGGEFYICLYLGSGKFDEDRPAEVRVLLNRAAVCFAHGIDTRPAETLLSILECFTSFVGSQFYASGFLACFHRHLFDLIRLRYGVQHSLTKLLTHILRMAERDAETRQRMYQSLLSMIIGNLTGSGTSDLWEWYLELADSFELCGQFQKAKESLLDAMNCFANETSRGNMWKIRCSFDLAWHYINHYEEMDDEAERILTDIIEAGTDEVTGSVDYLHTYLASNGLSQLARKRGETEAAISFYRLEIQAAKDQWGVDSITTLKAMVNFACYLRSLGREEEAIEAESLVRLTDEFSELDME